MAVSTNQSIPTITESKDEKIDMRNARISERSPSRPVASPYPAAKTPIVTMDVKQKEPR